MTTSFVRIIPNFHLQVNRIKIFYATTMKFVHFVECLRNVVKSKKKSLLPCSADKYASGDSKQ